MHDNEPALVPTMAALAARAHGRVVVLRTVGALYDAHGLIIQAERTGVPVCLTGQNKLLFAVTTKFLCGPREEAAGFVARLWPRPYGRSPASR